MNNSPQGTKAPKNIVICSDGTGNSAIKDRGTNVFKLYEAVDTDGWRNTPAVMPMQIAFYDDGVGTQELLPLRLLGQAFGYGLARNVRKLYADLARVYEPGDKIFLFGFSRGAYTVRTLLGLIECCGIPNGKVFLTDDALKEAAFKSYKEYRKKYRTFGADGSRNIKRTISHDASYSMPSCTRNSPLTEKSRSNSSASGTPCAQSGCHLTSWRTSGIDSSIRSDSPIGS